MGHLCAAQESAPRERARHARARAPRARAASAQGARACAHALLPSLPAEERERGGGCHTKGRAPKQEQQNKKRLLTWEGEEGADVVQVPSPNKNNQTETDVPHLRGGLKQFWREVEKTH